MTELAEVFRRHGAKYREKYVDRIPFTHRQAMQAIEQCRTEVLGGHVYNCQDCDETLYSYHSCKNRHCPKCQNGTAEQWLERQTDLLLPVRYFMVTFTLPASLRQVVRSHQKRLYNLLFRASAAALQKLAGDPRFVGGQIGMVGVLHTWKRDLNFHPHVHYLVPAGGLSKDGQTWLPVKKDFLVPVKPLSIMFRVAISNIRILKLEDGQVTFRYTASDTGKTRYCTVIAEAFIRRFLQHVLPKGFIKVRYYGFFSSGNRHRLRQTRKLLGVCSSTQSSDGHQANATPPEQVLCCPKCGQVMQLTQTAQATAPATALTKTSVGFVFVPLKRSLCTIHNNVGFVMPAYGR